MPFHFDDVPDKEVSKSPHEVLFRFSVKLAEYKKNIEDTKKPAKKKSPVASKPQAAQTILK